MTYKEYTVRVHDKGAVEWFKAGTKLIPHREDGPAIEFTNGDKYWYKEGKRHREDGPAIECANNHKEWYLEGKFISEAEFNKRLKKDSCDGKVIEMEGKKYKLILIED